MLDRREIRQNPDAVRAAVRVKGIDLDVDELLQLDKASRELQHELDQKQALRRSSAREFAQADEARRAELRAEHAELEIQLRTLRDQLAETTEKLQALMLLTPMIPWEGAPVGPDESANVTIRTYGIPPEFDFQILDHVGLLEKRGWADFTRARKVAGERAYALTGDMVLLERAVHSYALDLLRDKDFTLVSVPSLVREEALIGTGQFPAHREETYAITADDLYLAGTAEVALVGFHSNEILDHKHLPIRYAGISPCFRRKPAAPAVTCAGCCESTSSRRSSSSSSARRTRPSPTAGTRSCSAPPSSCCRGSAWRMRWWSAPPATWAPASTG